MAESDTTIPSPPAPTRRTFLDWILAACSAVAAAALAIPGVMFLWPAARGGGVANVEVQGAADLQPGQGKKVQVGSTVVVVIRTRDGYEAYSAHCTHLGCLVSWNSADKVFECPCHAATFDAHGGVVSGPPSAPLTRFDVKEIEGKVYVSA